VSALWFWPIHELRFRLRSSLARVLSRLSHACSTLCVVRRAQSVQPSLVRALHVAGTAIPASAYSVLLPTLCSIKAELETEAAAAIQFEGDRKSQAQDKAAPPQRSPMMCACLRVVKELFIGYAQALAPSTSTLTLASADAKHESDSDPVIASLLTHVPPLPARPLAPESSSTASAAAAAAAGGGSISASSSALLLSDSALSAVLQFAQSQLALPSFFAEYIEQHLYAPETVTTLLPFVRRFAFGVAEPVWSVVCCVLQPVVAHCQRDKQLKHEHTAGGEGKAEPSRGSGSGSRRTADTAPALIESDVSVPRAWRAAASAVSLTDWVLLCARYECTFDSFVREFYAADQHSTASSKAPSPPPPPHTPWVTPLTRQYAQCALQQLSYLCLPPLHPTPQLPAVLSPITPSSSTAAAAINSDSAPSLTPTPTTPLIALLFGRLFRSLRAVLVAGKSGSEWKRHLTPRFELFSLFQALCDSSLSASASASASAAGSAVPREWCVAVSAEQVFEPLPVLLMLADDHQIHHKAMGLVLLSRLIHSQPSANLRWHRLVILAVLQVLYAAQPLSSLLSISIPLSMSLHLLIAHCVCLLCAVCVLRVIAACIGVSRAHSSGSVGGSTLCTRSDSAPSRTLIPRTTPSVRLQTRTAARSARSLLSHRRLQNLTPPPVHTRTGFHLCSAATAGCV
jgi:hypothetical protein